MPRPTVLLVDAPKTPTALLPTKLSMPLNPFAKPPLMFVAELLVRSIVTAVVYGV